MTQIRNSKYKLITLVLNSIITGGPGFAKRCNKIVMNVLVIEYFNLRFICNLVLEIWDFIDLKKPTDVNSLAFTSTLPWQEGLNLLTVTAKQYTWKR